MESCIMNSSFFDFIMDHDFRGKVIRYVLDRACEGGGFCFYKLEEPNGSDTFYALSVLKMLGQVFRDSKTVEYLKSMQNDDGSYENIFMAFYSIKSLGILNVNPALEPTSYLQSHIKTYDIYLLPAEVTSIFKQMHILMDLCSSLGIRLDEHKKLSITDFILKYQNIDCGFGSPYSNLIETAQALQILRWLDYPVESTLARNFIVKCKNPVFGFVNVPGTSPSFLEYVHAGATASFILSHHPEYLAQCIEFIRACQNSNGGFSRATHTGIATLEDTYYAIHSLCLLTASLQAKGSPGKELAFSEET
ncbi:MAG: prenyltransferase/squalene oxidase repeat-containing protein [Syntrophales bacterium]